MLKKFFVLLMIFLFTIFLLGGCFGRKNHAPLINRIYTDVNSFEILTGQKITLTVEAEDEEDDELTYKWVIEKGDGRITGLGKSVSYHAPATEGSTTIKVIVSDNGSKTTESITLKIVKPEPLLLMIMAPIEIIVNQSVSVVAEVSSGDAEEIENYNWSATGGVITGSGKTVTYTAPSVPGNITITVTAERVFGNDITASFDLSIVLGENHAPVIDNFVLNDTEIKRLDQTIINVSANDLDNDNLTYNWTATGGTIDGTGPEVTYIAPDKPGIYDITVTVSDGREGEATQTGAITVINTNPVIDSINVLCSNLKPGDSTTVEVVASDGDNDPLTYQWIAEQGTIIGDGSTITYKPPLSAGEYQLTLNINDGYGGETQEIFSISTIQVPPVIDSFSITPEFVTPGETTVIEVIAIDGNEDPLTYSWSADFGIITGTGNTITYEPPKDKGVYTILVEVSDGSGSSSGSVEVTVEDGVPVITSITATPESLQPGQSTLLEVSASDANGDDLTYLWKNHIGDVIGNTEVVNYTPPIGSGTYSVSVEVSDGTNVVSDSVDVQVINVSPIINTVTADFVTLNPLEETSVTVDASDSNGDSLTYNWSAVKGQITGTGPGIIYEPPVIGGTYSVVVEVSDGINSVSESIDIVVNNVAPVITSVEANPEILQPNQSTELSVSATDSNTDILSYTWKDSSGNVIGNLSTIIYTPPITAGTYTICVEVSDGINISSDSLDLTVNNVSPLITSITANQEVLDPGALATITVTATDENNDVLSYNWSASVGVISGEGSTVNYEPPFEAGTYRVDVQVSDGINTTTGYINITVSDGSPVITDISATPALLEPGESTQLMVTATDFNGDPLSYTWKDYLGNEIGTGMTVNYIPPVTAGVYPVTVEVSDGINISIDTVDITVNNISPVISSLVASTTTLNPGDSTTITVTAGDDNGDSLTYNWSVENGTITGSGNSITYQPPIKAGTYTVDVEVYDGVNTVHSSLEVNVVNIAPTIDSLTATPSAVDPGQPIQLKVEASDQNNDTLSYTWKDGPGDVIGSGESIFYIPPPQAATYQITVEVFDGTVTITDSLNVIVNNVNPIVDSLTANPNLLNPGESTVITIGATDSNGDDLSYLWSTDQGEITGTGESITYTPPAASGTYTVNVDITDGPNTISDSIDIVVTNVAPTIATVTVTPEAVNPGQNVTLEVQATDLNGDGLIYTWKDHLENIIGSTAISVTHLHLREEPI